MGRLWYTAGVERPHSFPQTCFFLLLACFWVEGIYSAEPLLVVGKGDARIKGAFATGFLESPFDAPTSGGLVLLDIHLPVNISASVQKALDGATDSAVVMPEFLTGISQLMNAQVKVAARVKMLAWW
jgi:hypothetical protein